MSNKMEQIAEMLGVKIGEEFKVKGDDVRYRLTEEKGVQWFCEDDGKWESDTQTLTSLLVGRAEIASKPWKPNCGEEFYIPTVVGIYNKYVWNNGTVANNMYEAGIIFNNKEEAGEMSERIRKFVRQERGFEYEG